VATLAPRESITNWWAAEAGSCRDRAPEDQGRGISVRITDRAGRAPSGSSCGTEVSGQARM